MKPAQFEYHRATCVEHALELLGALDGARILAGGQSLVPALNRREVSPRHLVDIAAVRELSYVDRRADKLCLGAATPQRAVETSSAVAEDWPLMSAALRHVGSVQVRNRGTVGGALAQADPGAELPLAAIVLDAELVIRGAAGERREKAARFLRGPHATSLRAGEVLVEIQLPLPPVTTTGWSFREVRSGQSGAQVVGVGVSLSITEGGVIDAARIGRCATGLGQCRAWEAEVALSGRPVEDEVLGRAAAAATRELEPEEVDEGEGRYRRALSEALIRDGLRRAVASATLRSR